MSPDRSNTNIVRASLAEIVGTFFLVFAGTAVAVAATLGSAIAGPELNSLAVGLTFGLVLAALVSALGHVSGAHFNPAVTIGLASIRKFPWAYVPFYIIAQLVGAILAAGAVWAIFGEPARSAAALAATMPAAGASDGQVFLVEALVTFLLVFVITGVATDERAHASTGAIAIGFALGIAVLVAGPISGGSANPARTLGPMIMAGKFTGVWIYIVAPIVGGIIAALVYNMLLSRTAPPRPEPEQVLRG